MKFSKGKEDYLKVIFTLEGDTRCVTNKQIADTLNISSPSVSEMLSKLASDRLIEYTQYKGSRLTPMGRSIAIKIIRRHRLVEVFLHDVLGYALSSLHHDAEKIEHIDSDFFFERLDAILNHPTHCPHGGTIPRQETHLEEYTHDLVSFKQADVIQIMRIIDNQILLKYFEDNNLMLNDICTVEKKDDINHIIFLRKGIHIIPFSYSLASKVFGSLLE